MENNTIIKGRKFRIVKNLKSKNREAFSGWTITRDIPFKKGIPINENKILKKGK